jgi:hypothetical protein
MVFDIHRDFSRKKDNSIPKSALVLDISMREILKNIILRTPLYFPIRKIWQKKRWKEELLEWEKKGRPAPSPHLIKQGILQDYAKRYGLKILVESGTYYGDMVDAMRPYFRTIYSIELSKKLFMLSARRFSSVGNVKLIHGDSGAAMPDVLSKISEPALFWLDGHYSGGVTAKGVNDTPILNELEHILGSDIKGHIILVDDARLFKGDPSYPRMAALNQFILSKRTDMEMMILDDCIRITPKSL